MVDTKQRVTPFLLFEGQAEEAMNYYIATFDQAEILNIQRYGPGEAGVEGSVMLATFSIYDQTLMCIDSSTHHEFTFTPAISLFVACATDEEIERYFEQLSRGGQVFMPLAEYPGVGKLGWLADKYGVSWQLNLQKGV